jgi:hypothetical protein
MNAHATVYEGLLFLWWSAFVDWCIEQEKDTNDIATSTALFAELHAHFNCTSDQDNRRRIVGEIDECLAKVKCTMKQFNTYRDCHSTHNMWVMYLDMVEISQTVTLYDNGERLVDMCEEYKLRPAQSRFSQP